MMMMMTHLKYAVSLWSPDEVLHHLQWGKSKCHQGICTKIDEYSYTKSSAS